MFTQCYGVELTLVLRFFRRVAVGAVRECTFPPLEKTKTKQNPTKKTTYLLVDTVHLITLLVISMLECLVANKCLFSFFQE